MWYHNFCITHGLHTEYLLPLILFNIRITYGNTYDLSFVSTYGIHPPYSSQLESTYGLTLFSNTRSDLFLTLWYNGCLTACLKNEQSVWIVVIQCSEYSIVALCLSERLPGKTSKARDMCFNYLMSVWLSAWKTKRNVWYHVLTASCLSVCLSAKTRKAFELIIVYSLSIETFKPCNIMF